MNSWRDRVKELKENSDYENRKSLKKQTTASSPSSTDKTQERVLDIHLGIDFGTTWTKVAYRNLNESYSADVVFTGKEGIPASFARSVLYRNTEGYRFPDDISAFESSSLPGETLIRDIKMKFNKDNNYFSDYRASVFYLSCIIRKSKEFILRQLKLSGTISRINWTATIGMPTAYRKSPIERRNQKLLSQAWHLADRWDKDTITFSRLYQLIKENPEINKSDLSVMPELQANIYALTHSPNMPDGLYALFDIGGGTLDGSVFNIQRKNGMRQVQVYQTKVDDFGVDIILQLLEREGYLIDENGSILDWRDVMKSDLYLLPEEIQSNKLNEYTKPINILTGEVIWKSKQASRTELVWYEKELPFLYCGGGADYHWYRKSIESTYNRNNYSQSRIPRFSPKDIPRPDEEEFRRNSIKEEEFNRFFVAYGLSFPEEDHHRIASFPEHHEVEKSDRSEEKEYQRWNLMNELYGEGYV